MGHTARERLTSLLDDTEAPGSFSAQILAPADTLQVEVVGLGAVQTPVRGPLAKKLIAVGRPATFGRAEQTLTDTSVRDTWEITPDLVTLDGPAWEATLGVVLDDVRDELGLPPTTTLRAELHAMLIYGKGQFFLSHQDSEKDDAMVGTLVVSLPSAHTGGELIVEHGGESVTYRTSKQDLSFVAFYADCRHEVKPVTSGYRVTLTFNLLADGEADTQGSGPLADLARCLTEHFAAPATPRYSRTDLDPPNRLVYLLDHEYTQRGLSWNRLKGADAERAALLRAAAERAGCEAVLARKAPIPATPDIDLTPEASQENLTRLSLALKELGARIRTEAAPEGPPFSHDATSLAAADVRELICANGEFSISVRPVRLRRRVRPARGQCAPATRRGGGGHRRRSRGRHPLQRVSRAPRGPARSAAALPASSHASQRDDRLSNVCRYRLHSGLSSHTHQVRGVLLVVDFIDASSPRFR
jgi:hypothetical protein